jgi:hypothetical protein
MRKYVLVLFLFYGSFIGAQSTYVPLNSDYSYLLDRYEIKSNNKVGSGIFSSIKPFLRKDAAQLADTLLQDSSTRFSKIDKFNLQYLQADNWEFSKVTEAGNSKKPFLKTFYQKKNAFYQFKNNYFEVQANPVFYGSYGREQGSSNIDYINTRGIEVRGSIDKKIGFYTFMADNQALFPNYVTNQINTLQAVPGEGSWSNFKTRGADFFTAKGYITFNITKHICAQLGQDKNFIGNGYRSLFLSDFSSNYMFLKTSTNVGILQYTNIFAKLNPYHAMEFSRFHPTKYMAMHYLSLNLSKKFTFGIFESITFGNTDSIQPRPFDFYYVNPFIFYKAVEEGGPDKAHIGFDLKWNFLRHISLYGQVFIDEFMLKEIVKHTQWWGNKQAVQAGLKYIDVAGIKNLDLQLEANIVRPYTYTHFSVSKYNNFSNYSNYTNYQQPLADPLGANFYEFIGILRYQPFKRITLTGKAIYAIIGLDTPGQNWGSNIFLDYTTRVKDYGNSIAQGARTTILYTDFTVSYQVKHNMFIDLKAIVRTENSALATYNSKTNFITMAFRWNIGQRLNEY